MKSRGVTKFAPGLLTLALLVGCGQVLDYPKVQPERDTALCHNGVDDDVDGETDCDDSDCLGSCSEESSIDCSDARDNDGDGLSDGADPRCWLSSPPTAERCAKAYGAEIVNHFDAAPTLTGIDANQGIYVSEWAPWGNDYGNHPIVQRAPHLGRRRQDLLLRFRGNTTRSADLDLARSLGSYVRQFPFSGSVQDFELSFSASVPPGAILSAGIVPVGLAPSTVAPIASAETALLAVIVDAFTSPPSLSLVVDGLATSNPLVGGASCEDTNRDCLGRVALTVDSEEVLATFTNENGVTTETRSPAPASLSLPPARLVLWGGSRDPAVEPSGPGARLDDLTLHVEPELPCGIAVPQIPGATCDIPWSQGYTVSVARDADGEHCALVTSSDWDADAMRLSPPVALNVWHSPDGDDWTPATSIPPPEAGATILGAGIAADAAGLHAALALRSGTTGDVQLAFADGPDCWAWGSPVLGQTLPRDAEAPSYVIARRRHEVYFTRPPGDDNKRTLWRVLRDAPDVEPELIAELPLGVEVPVSLQSVGNRDLVLAAPSRAGSGGRGIVLFVADPDLREFRPVGTGPVLALPPSPDLPSGAGKLGFDDREVLSAAIGMDGERGFLFYGGRSTEGAFSSGDYGTPVLAVGTARLLLHGEATGNAAIVPEKACGNGTCESDEDCVGCGADCLCGGKELLSDAFASDKPWELLSSDANPRGILYVDSDPPVMSFAGGAPTWAALPLDHPVTGDFRLSFDALVEFGDIDGGVAHVGLGTKPLDAASPFASGPAPDAGVFAGVVQCYSQMLVVPLAVAGVGVDTPPAAACWGENSQVLGAWQRVVLARQGNRVTVTTPASAWAVTAQDRFSCGVAESAVSYAGALPPLTHLLIGFGGGPFADSVPNGHPGTIANIELRSFDDPDDCPAPKERCDMGSEAPTCVDTSRTPEHCGACGRRCGVLEACVGGECVCASRANVAGTLECDGACVDPQASLDHCGECGHACNEQCVSGVCDPIKGGTCEAPFDVPPEGGNFPLLFPPLEAPEYAIFCDYYEVVDQIIGTWTPTQSGMAFALVDVGEYQVSGSNLLDSVVAVTQGAACENWLACNDDIDLGVNVNSRLSFPVVAGETYQVHVGLWDYRPPQAQVGELSIGFEP